MSDKYLILVNKDHILKDESIFEKVDCNSKFADNRQLEKEAFLAFLKLKEYIQTLGYTIEIESGYRGISYQQRVWDECLEEKGLEHTKKYVAVPGYSEHHTGLAVDFTLFENGKFIIEHELEMHPVVKLVEDNAYKYGFIIRYPKGKENITGYNYEPWHLRYIKDVEIAKYIKDNNLCLEEYLDNVK